MSLGLGDLNKKKRPATSQANSQAKKPQARVAVEAVPLQVKSENKSTSSKTQVGSRTARPWSSEGLTKGGGRNRKRMSVSDVVMNEEWLSAHSAPLFWVDLSKNSRLGQVQELLVKVENRLQDALTVPKRIAHSLGLLRK